MAYTMNEENQSWISKTDVMEYIRCPYRFCIARDLGIPPTDLMDENFKKYIIEKGHIFEQSAIDMLPIVQLDILSLFRKSGIPLDKIAVDKNNTIFNKTSYLKGKPDAFVIEDRLVPVEIKNHKEIEKTDRLELAYYCLLTETDNIYITDGILPCIIFDKNIKYKATI